ncbi:MAG: S-layer protein, partial [Candidatus Saccharimonas sp.]|nr:S-layer protein [Planctomycetaceae bacterium]
MMLLRVPRLCSFAVFVCAIPAWADSLIVLPREVKLTGPEARQSLLVEMADGPLVTGPVRDGLSFVSEDERVVKVIHGRVVPMGNGSTTIKVSANGQTAATKVVVEKFDVAHQWSFRNHVQSVLSKTGCNGGACHGAVAGKNGFKLSLRGYDPEGDFFAITRQSRGRRVVPHDPGRSLVLTKPTGAIPHKGGLRFGEDSIEYRVVSEWIAQGQVAPAADDARIKRLEILPEASRLKAGVEQPMIVRAHFSDGRVEDVTRWAKYTSTNHTVCSVDDQGLVKVLGSGEGAIVAWYLAQNTTATVTVPYQQPVAPETFASAKRA